MFTHPQESYSKTLEKTIRHGDRWLDLGCGRQIVPSWAAPIEQQMQLTRRAKLVVGVDVDAAIKEHPLLSARVMAFGYDLPFADSSFDVVTANMVMEHVENPEELLREVGRVLAPGGRFVFLTPNARYWSVFIASLVPDVIKKPIVKLLEEREADDVFPTRYRANTQQDVLRLATTVGLRVEQLDAVGPYPTFIRFRWLSRIEGFFLRILCRLPQWRSNFVVSLVR